MPFTSAAIGTGIGLAATPGINAGAAFLLGTAEALSVGGVIADVAIVGGLGLAAAGQAQAAKQQEAANKFNAQVQAEQAKQEEFVAQQEAGILSERGRKLRAAQRTQFAKSGVGITGTPLLVFEQTASDIAQDVAQTRFGGQRRADFFRSQSSLSLFQAGSARRAGPINVGTTLLTGATRGISLFNQLR